MTNKEQVASLLAMDDNLPMVESITDGLPVDDYSPEEEKDITLDDIFGVTPNDQPKTFGDSFASIGDDTQTEDGRKMITEAFVSEIGKMPGPTIEVSDIPAIAAVVQMRTGAKGDVEGFLMQQIMQTNKTLAEQNKTELNPDGAVSEMAKEAEQQGTAADPLAPQDPANPGGPLPEVPPIAETPAPSLETNPADDLNSLLPPDAQQPAVPEAGAGADGTLGLGDIGVDDNDLAAASASLDGLGGAAPAAGETDTSGLDNALAGLDNLDDNMFGGETAAAGGESAGEAAGTSVEPASETPAAPAAEPAAETTPAEPAAEDDKKKDGTEDGPKQEAAETDLPPMLEAELDKIHNNFVMQEAAQDNERAEFVRGVVAQIEAQDKKDAAMLEAAEKRRKECDNILESTRAQLDRKAMLESAAHVLADGCDAARKAVAQRNQAFIESIVADTKTKVAQLATATAATAAPAMVESATARQEQAVGNAAEKLQGELNTMLENAGKPAAQPMVESANKPQVDPKQKRAALIESIVGASAQSRLNQIRDRINNI